MALLGGIRLWERAVELAESDLQQPARWDAGARVSPLSPWAKRGNLAHVPYNPDVFGKAASGPVSPQDVLRCSPVKKGRAVLHSQLLRPLVAIRYDSTTDTDTVLRGDAAPTWLYRTNTDIPPDQRLADVLDDHLYHEASVLALQRGPGVELGGRGAINDAVRVPYDWWTLDDDGYLLVDDQPVDPDQVLYIPGPSLGLCIDAQDEVRQWRAISRNIAMRLASPAPSIILEDPEAGTAPPEDEEIDALIAAAAEARRSPDGGVMYVGGLKATVVPNNDDSGLFIAARNALRLDFANHLGLPAALLDGSPATASLTYSTAEGARDQLADLSLAYWTNPIERALSQDAVVPRGTRVRFDLGDLFAATNAPTGAKTQD